MTSKAGPPGTTCGSEPSSSRQPYGTAGACSASGPIGDLAGERVGERAQHGHQPAPAGVHDAGPAEYGELAGGGGERGAGALVSGSATDTRPPPSPSAAVAA